VSGSVFKRCTRCGRRVRERACRSCGPPSSFTWGYSAYLGKRQDGGWIRQTRTSFPNKKDAERALREVLAAVEERQVVPASGLTLGAFLADEWLVTTAPPQVKFETWGDRKRNLEAHVIPRVGAIKLQELNAAHLNHLYADLLGKGRADGKGGLSPTSVRRIHAWRLV
jgi:hypothetical protein